MNVVFLCSPRRLQHASTVLRACQLQQIVAVPLAERGHDAICTTDLGIHDTLTVLSKGFLIDADINAIHALKGRRNVLVADYVDWKPDPLVVAEIDGLMASSHQQRDYLRSAFPDKPCHLVTHHVDTQIPRITPPVDRLRVGYFGNLTNARHSMELQGLVAFVRTDTENATRQEWMSELANYNCHYGLRTVQSWDGLKPFLKGFIAAHCGAPIITEIGESDAAYYLPPDYPFFMTAGDAGGVAKDIRRIAETFGGPEWRYSCDVMREVRERSSVPVVIKEFETMVCEYIAPGHRSPVGRPDDGPSATSTIGTLNDMQMQSEMLSHHLSLTEVFLTHRGRTSDKWEQYLPVYDAELGRFQEIGAPVRLLEIGVQNGGSLEIWEKFLPIGSRIVGIDINSACASLRFDGDVTVLIADAADERALGSVLGDSAFDVIIDDASHRPGDVIATFRATFPRLAPGGLYVIEDLHTAYRHAYGGGFRAPGSAIEWLKILVDALHIDHFERPDLQGPEMLEPLRAMNREIGRVSFYDSIAVIERLPKQKQAPWRRVTTGMGGPIPAQMPNVGAFEVARGADVFLGAAASAEWRRARFEESLARLANAEARLAETMAELSEVKLRLHEAAAEAGRERTRAEAIAGSTIWRASAPLRGALNGLRRIR